MSFYKKNNPEVIIAIFSDNDLNGSCAVLPPYKLS